MQMALFLRMVVRGFANVSFLYDLLFAIWLSSEVCASSGNGCERFCASRSLLGSYVHQESI